MSLWSRIKSSSVQPAGMDVIEPTTGIRFAPYLSLPEGSTELKLMGIGHRERVIIGVKFQVYAVALYMHPDALESQSSLLAAWHTKNAAHFCADPSFFRACSHCAFPKCLLLVLNRSVTGSEFVTALAEELSPRVAATDPTGEASGAQTRMEAAIQAHSLARGTTISLAWVQRDILQVGVSPPLSPQVATPCASIASLPLLSALFDVFLGPRAVAPSLMRSVAATVAACIASEG